MLEERKQLARDAMMDNTDRAFREMQLQNPPKSTAAAVNELASYDWQSSTAREACERIKDLLGREILDQRFAGMKQALEGATQEDRGPWPRCWRISTSCSTNTAAARTPTRTSRSSWPSSASLPGEPESVEELMTRSPSARPPPSGSCSPCPPSSARS